ncbi:MAG: heme exporter protein CcmB [Solirubrobacterales bacterium]
MRRPIRQTGLFAAAAAILRKDLKLELRSFETITATAIFTVATFVVFHFAFDRDELAGDLAAGAFWVTILFAAALTINRLLANERSQGGYETLLLAPIDRNSILLAKFAFLFIMLGLLEVFALLTFALLLLQPGLTAEMVPLLPVLILANIGIGAIGTIVSALATDTSQRELLVPLMTLPLFTPLLIGAARATAPLMEVVAKTEDLGRWLSLMALYDSVFLLVAFAVFDFVLED